MKSRILRVVLPVIAAVVIALIWANHRVDLVFRTCPDRRVGVERWILAKKWMIVGEGRAGVEKAFGEPAELSFWITSIREDGDWVALKVESGSNRLSDELRGSVMEAAEMGGGDREKLFKMLQQVNGCDPGGLRDLLAEIGSESLECHEVWFYRNELDLGLEFTFVNGRVTAVGERF